MKVDQTTNQDTKPSNHIERKPIPPFSYALSREVDHFDCYNMSLVGRDTSKMIETLLR